MTKDLVWGAFFGVLFSIIGSWVYVAVHGPHPYSNAEVTSVEQTATGYELTVTYTEGDCILNHIDVFGINTGVLIHLKDAVVTKTPFTEGEEGHQVSIVVDTKGKQIDTLEIRTRHDCGGRLVDRSLARVDTDTEHKHEW